MKISTESTPAKHRQPILILGASGYIGGRLIPLLLANVLHYLTGCLEVPETAGETFGIGPERIPIPK